MNDLDEQLAELGALDRTGAPPMPEALRREVEGSPPTSARRPRIQHALLEGGALILAALLVMILGLRPDLGGLSSGYLVSLAIGWTAAMGALSWIAVRPPRRSALIRWRHAGALALLTGLFFVTAGLLWTEAVPGLSIEYRATPAAVLRWAPYCLAVGTGSALLPLTLGAVLLRRAVPLGARWVAAALGALGGCVGGLVLHLHCNIAEPTHFGLVHGGVVLIAAGLGALLVGRLLRP